MPPKKKSKLDTAWEKAQNALHAVDQIAEQNPDMVRDDATMPHLRVFRMAIMEVLNEMQSSFITEISVVRNANQILVNQINVLRADFDRLALNYDTLSQTVPKCVNSLESWTKWQWTHSDRSRISSHVRRFSKVWRTDPWHTCGRWRVSS